MPVDPHASRIGLHMAAMSGNIKVVRALLGKRSPATNVEERDLLGDSGLLKAARYGHLAVVQALLEAGGADANAQDNNGWNCLHVSIANNHEKVFFAVLAREHDSPPTNIEAITSSGDTPLHTAAYHHRKWAVSALLRLGANLDAANDTDQRPVQVARQEDIRTMMLIPTACGGKSGVVVQRRQEDGDCNKEDRVGLRSNAVSVERENDRAGMAGINNTAVYPLGSKQHMTRQGNTSIRHHRGAKSNVRLCDAGLVVGNLGLAQDHGSDSAFEEDSSDSDDDGSDDHTFLVKSGKMPWQEQHH